MAKTVYLAHYDDQNKRYTSPAGIAVMSYIIGALSRCEKKVTVLSSALSKTHAPMPRERLRLLDNVELLYPALPACPHAKNYPARYLRRLRHARLLEDELLHLLEDGDTLVVYHDLSLISTVRRVRQKKRIRLVIQACEIYADVNGKRQRKRELDFFALADAYIFSSELLEQQINLKKAPFAICLGTYQSAPNLGGDRTNDTKLRCVYAGTLDPRKGGAAAIKAASHLDQRYHLHLLGFGSEQQVKNIQRLIEQTAAQSTCTLSFDGCLSGEDYLRFLQSCDIGLCTQDPSASFSATSFPSKILSYLANGLRVVSIRIPAVENSAVGKQVLYYEQQTPEQIAQAIKGADLQRAPDGREVIDALDRAFVQELEKILRSPAV